jgi:hypothetical protein
MKLSTKLLGIFAFLWLLAAIAALFKGELLWALVCVAISAGSLDSYRRDRRIPSPNAHENRSKA